MNSELVLKKAKIARRLHDELIPTHVDFGVEDYDNPSDLLGSNAVIHNPVPVRSGLIVIDQDFAKDILIAHEDIELTEEELGRAAAFFESGSSMKVPPEFNFDVDGTAMSNFMLSVCYYIVVKDLPALAHTMYGNFMGKVKMPYHNVLFPSEEVSTAQPIVEPCVQEEAQALNQVQGTLHLDVPSHIVNIEEDEGNDDP